MPLLASAMQDWPHCPQLSYGTSEITSIFLMVFSRDGFAAFTCGSGTATKNTMLVAFIGEVRRML